MLTLIHSRGLTFIEGRLYLFSSSVHTSWVPDRQNCCQVSLFGHVDSGPSSFLSYLIELRATLRQAGQLVRSVDTNHPKPPRICGLCTRISVFSLLLSRNFTDQSIMNACLWLSHVESSSWLTNWTWAWRDGTRIGGDHINSNRQD